MMMVRSSIALAHDENVVHQLGGLVVRHAGRGLVEQQQFRLADQRAADLDAAAVDHRQAGDRLEHAVGERRLEHLDQRARGAIVVLEFALEVAAAGIRLNQRPWLRRLWLPIMMLSKIDSGSDRRERWKVREMPAR